MADLELTSINVKNVDIPLTEQQSKLPEEVEFNFNSSTAYKIILFLLNLSKSSPNM
jgi:hypothetical protein